MAKKTAKKSPPKKKPAGAKKSATPAAAPKPKVAPKPAMDVESIGHAAGHVWGALHDGGPQTIAAVKKAVDCPADVAMLAIGWLAREGKLEFTQSGRSVKIALRD